jgi:membrane protein implicated in regulation of membrane protease activity
MTPDIVYSLPVLWIAAGIALVAAEALALPGVGFLFAGLGSITTGLAVSLGYCDGIIPQMTCFFVATSAWGLILWFPLKRMQQGRDSGYSDMIGARAVVAEDDMELGKTGKVKWSGAIMNAVLAQDCKQSRVAKGADVKILDVVRGLLVVSPDTEKEK